MTQPRTEAAILLRDRALAVIQAHGKQERIGGALFASAEHESLRMVLRTPFTRWSNEGDSESFDRAVMRQNAVTLPNGLDIWAGKKVLSLQWDHQRVEVISFRRGDWEHILNASSGPAPRSGGDAGVRLAKRDDE